MFRLKSFLKQAIELLAVAALCLSGSVEVHAAEAEIVSTCQRYLAAEGDDSAELGSQIAGFDGAIGPIIQALAESVPVDRQDLSGVLADQPFADPQLREACADDLLHFFVPPAYTPATSFGLLIFMHGGGGNTPRTAPRHVVSHPDEISFDEVDVDGPWPAWKETREAFDAQTLQIGTRLVKAGIVDAKIAADNRIEVRSENVQRFSIWLHPSMVDFARPVQIAVNGVESEHDVRESLLDALRSYRRRQDWGLIYHTEITLTVEQ